MATQASYINDLQAINHSAVQACQLDLINSENGSVLKGRGMDEIGCEEKIASGTSSIIQSASAHPGQQFIVATTVEQQLSQNNPGEMITIQPSTHTVYPAHVQYIDNNDGAIYSNGQIQHYQDYGQSNMYNTVSGTYYQTSNAQGLTGLVPVGGSMQTFQGQIIHQSGGNAYLIHSGTMDGDGSSLSHTTRASPATVQWLLDNYETSEGVSLPRSTLYYHYLRHCQEHNLDPMNPASFGKLIRSVFLGLRTRRLGTRGNSKYHYYGIRIKASSALNQFTDDHTMAMRHQSVYTSKRVSRQDVERENEDRLKSQEDNIGRGGWESHNGGGSRSCGKGEVGDGDGFSGPVYGSDASSHAQQQNQQFLGDTSLALPVFSSIDIGRNAVLPDGITRADVEAFEKLYRDHAEAVVDVVVNLQFSLVETLWQAFWRTTPDELRGSEFAEQEQQLPEEVLCRLSKFPPVQRFVCHADYSFYQALVEVLVPDVLRPIPSSLTQAIRNFAKSLEGWLKSAMLGIPDAMVRAKMGAVGAFGQTLRRYTSLNHLAQAARAVLQNNSQINQMLADLNRVDFANVQEQASWVCQCEDSVVQQLEQDFKKTLKDGNSLEQWAVWLETVVNQILKPYEGSVNFAKAARQFLLKWSFYSSMVIRDLTLRSAASFGSFHLIRLLYDEFMFYLVEHKVANATGETPIAVMGELRQMSNTVSSVIGDTLDNPSSVPSTGSSQTTCTSASQSVQSLPSTTAATGASAYHPAGVVLLTSNARNFVSGTGATTITVRATCNGVTTSSLAVTPTENSTVVVLSGTAASSAARCGHAVAATMPSGGAQTALTVRAASGTRTILVMPVSTAQPSAGAVGPSVVKRIKTE